MQLTSDQTQYTVGASANLTAIALVEPTGSDDEFFIGATFNGVAVSVSQAPGGAGFFQTGPLARGLNVWTVQLFLEDKAFSRQLNETIAALNLQDAQIITQLGKTTDSNQISALQAELSQNQLLINEASNQLTILRRPFGASQTLNFYAN